MIEKIKRERMLVAFTLLGFLIIAFIVVTLGNMLATQVIQDLGGLIKVTQDPVVLNSIWLSMYTAFLATLVAFIFGVPLAYILARKEFLGKSLIESIVDVPVVVPHTAAGIALYTVFMHHGGLIGAPLSSLNIVCEDAVPGIVFAMLFVSAPFLINSARDGFKSVDPRLENVARSLGASQWHTFCKISFPLAFRHILTGSILSWARAISEFGAVIFLVSWPRIAPLLMYERFESYGLSTSRPIAVLLIFICLTVFIFLRLASMRWQRHDSD